MRNPSLDTLTEAVLGRYAQTPDPRLRAIIQSLVQHLHAFAVDVRLTESEWAKGIAFLTATGHMCDDKRQEFILLSDVLGLSMLTVVLGQHEPPAGTDATVLGPFHVPDAPRYEQGDDIANGAQGTPCRVFGSVRGTSGEAIPNAILDVWQADADGLYDVQYTDIDHPQARGQLTTDEHGQFAFKTIVPEAYPIPTDGPVGALLAATGNHPWRPAHLHFMIKAPGYETLVTHLFRQGDPHLDTDPVFGVRESLIVDCVRDSDGQYMLQYDFVLRPAIDG